MAEPNSEHVVAAPSVPGSNYDAAAMGPLGSWSKPYPGVQPGHGWRHAHEAEGASGGGWSQT